MTSPERTRPARARLPGGGRRRSAHRRKEGAAALEFALLLPLYALMVMGIVDFGHLFFVKSVITNAAREGARTGAVQANAGTQAAAATTEAQKYLTAAGLGTGCRLDCPTVASAYNAPNVEVTITVPGQFRNLSGFGYAILPGFSNPFALILNMQAKSAMRWESLP
jgi:Flp pilus assembly protein TadG